MRIIKWFLLLFLVAFIAGVGYYWHLTQPPPEPVVEMPEVVTPARDPFETAQSLIAAGKKKEAAELLLDLANRSGSRDRYEVRFLAGKVLLDLQRYREAFEQFAEARDLDPNRLETYRPLVRSAREMGDLELALGAVIDGAARSPRGAYFQKEAGSLLLAGGQAKEALFYIRKARALEESASIWGLEGVALVRLGQEKAAWTAFRKAVSLKLKDPAALAEYGILAFKRGNPKEAYRALKEAVTAETGLGEAQYQLAIICDNARRRGEAIHHYRMALIADLDILSRDDRGMLDALRKRTQTALVMSPGNPETIFEAGFLAYLDGELEEALRLLDNFLGRIGSRETAGTAHGALREEAETLAERIRRELYPELAAVPGEGPEIEPTAPPDPDEPTVTSVNYDLVQSFKNRIHRDPKNPRLHYYLGLCYLKGKDSAQAVRHIKQALQLAPTMAEAHLHLGAAYQHQGMPREAVRHLTEAVKLVPQMADAHVKLGAVYLMEMGEPGKAIEHLEKAVTLCPDFSTGHSMLGDAYRIAGEPEKAYSYYRLAADYSAEGPVKEYSKQMVKTMSESMENQ